MWDEVFGLKPSSANGTGQEKTGADDRTAQGFPDLSAQNAISSDACGGAMTLGDQSFIVQAVIEHAFGLAARADAALWLIITDRFL